MESEGQVAGMTACPRHRNVQTALRCSRCETPICPRCLVQTPVGARCPECVKPAPLRTGGWLSQVTAVNVGVGIGMGAGLVSLLLQPFLGLFAFLLLAFAGVLVGDRVWRISRTPTRAMAIAACVAAIVGPLVSRALLLGPIGALNSLGLFGLLAVVVAGVVAWNRIPGR